MARKAMKMRQRKKTTTYLVLPLRFTSMGGCTSEWVTSLCGNVSSASLSYSFPSYSSRFDSLYGILTRLLSPNCLSASGSSLWAEPKVLLRLLRVSSWGLLPISSKFWVLALERVDGQGEQSSFSYSGMPEICLSSFLFYLSLKLLEHQMLHSMISLRDEAFLYMDCSTSICGGASVILFGVSCYAFTSSLKWTRGVWGLMTVTWTGLITEFLGSRSSSSCAYLGRPPQGCLSPRERTDFIDLADFFFSAYDQPSASHRISKRKRSSMFPLRFLATSPGNSHWQRSLIASHSRPISFPCARSASTRRQSFWSALRLLAKAVQCSCRVTGRESTNSFISLLVTLQMPHSQLQLRSVCSLNRPCSPLRNWKVGACGPTSTYCQNFFRI